MSEYEPQVYVKGDVERVAKSPAAAVSLKFEGFKPKVDANAEASSAPAVSSTPAPELPEPKTATPASIQPKPQPPAKPAEDKD